MHKVVSKTDSFEQQVAFQNAVKRKVQYIVIENSPPVLICTYSRFMKKFFDVSKAQKGFLKNPSHIKTFCYRNCVLSYAMHLHYVRFSPFY